MSSSGKWPQRAKAMKSEDVSLTSSGKSKCTTSHSAQLKARIDEALSRNVETVLVRLKQQIGRCLSGDACVHARRGVVSSIPRGQRAVPSATAATSDCDAFTTSDAEDDVCTPSTLDVLLDSLLVWVAVRCLSFVLWCCIGTDAT